MPVFLYTKTIWPKSDGRRWVASAQRYFH